MKKSCEHILCVDDEADILEVAQTCLEAIAGFKITALDSGAKAVAQAEQINPDLILLDMMMPEMDGASTLKELRRNPALDHIPIVFMTARVQPSEITEYFQMGAAGVIVKPFDPMALSGEIKGIWQTFHAGK